MQPSGLTIESPPECEVMAPERLVNTQLFDQDWTGGEAVGTLILTERDGKTYERCSNDARPRIKRRSQ